MPHAVSGSALKNCPPEVQRLARYNYKLLRENSKHPSPHFKEIHGSKYWSIRIGMHYRALGVPVSAGIQWFWIGTHEDYNKLIS